MKQNPGSAKKQSYFTQKTKEDEKSFKKEAKMVEKKLEERLIPIRNQINTMSIQFEDIMQTHNTNYTEIGKEILQHTESAKCLTDYSQIESDTSDCLVNYWKKMEGPLDTLRTILASHQALLQEWKSILSDEKKDNDFLNKMLNKKRDEFTIYERELQRNTQKLDDVFKRKHDATKTKKLYLTADAMEKALDERIFPIKNKTIDLNKYVTNTVHPLLTQIGILGTNLEKEWNNIKNQEVYWKEKENSLRTEIKKLKKLLQEWKDIFFSEKNDNDFMDTILKKKENEFTIHANILQNNTKLLNTWCELRDDTLKTIKDYEDSLEYTLEGKLLIIKNQYIALSTQFENLIQNYNAKHEQTMKKLFQSNQTSKNSEEHLEIELKLFDNLEKYWKEMESPLNELKIHAVSCQALIQEWKTTLSVEKKDNKFTNKMINKKMEEFTKYDIFLHKNIEKATSYNENYNTTLSIIHELINISKKEHKLVEQYNEVTKKTLYPVPFDQFLEQDAIREKRISLYSERVNLIHKKECIKNQNPNLNLCLANKENLNKMEIDIKYIETDKYLQKKSYDQALNKLEILLKERAELCSKDEELSETQPQFTQNSIKLAKINEEIEEIKKNPLFLEDLEEGSSDKEKQVLSEEELLELIAMDELEKKMLLKLQKIALIEEENKKKNPPSNAKGLLENKFE